MKEQNAHTKTCPNCKETFDCSFNYCPNCGQSSKDLKLNFKYFVSEFLSGMFNIDSKIFRTLRLLFFKPGKLSKEFIAGKRNSYIQPVRLYLIGSLIYFTVASLVTDPIKLTTNKGDELPDNIVTLENLDSLQSNLTQEDTTDIIISESVDSLFNGVTSVEKLKNLGSKEGRKKFIKNLQSNIPIGMFILVPLTALLLFMFFSKNSYYIEHLIFVIHLQTLIYILFTLFNLLELVVAENIINGISATLFFTIVFIWIKKYYEIGWWTTIWKTLLFLISYGLIFIVFITVLSAISIFLL